MSRYQRIEVTLDTVHHLRACKAQGLNFNDACNELGTRPKYVRESAKANGLDFMIHKIYPYTEFGIQFLPFDATMIESIIRCSKSVQFKWLTKSWLA